MKNDMWNFHILGFLVRGWLLELMPQMFSEKPFSSCINSLQTACPSLVCIYVINHINEWENWKLVKKKKTSATSKDRKLGKGKRFSLFPEPVIWEDFNLPLTVSDIVHSLYFWLIVLFSFIEAYTFISVIRCIFSASMRSEFQTWDACIIF